jgi:glucose-1-phosphate cytidylyltransferase
LKVAILAGGAGNRLAGDTEVGPKPMVEIGGHPLLWHIMHHYAHYGFKQFVIAVGYRGGDIKRYFAEYRLAESDVRIDLGSEAIKVHGDTLTDDWVVDVVDTGRWTETGGRVGRLSPYLDEGPFMLTFGDAVSDVDLGQLEDFHRSHERLATITAVHPPPRFGELRLAGDNVAEFSEKPMESGWINGGYMVMEPGVFDYIEGDEEPLSPGTLERLTADGQLAAYRHVGFWQGMDTHRDRVLLERLWETGSPPWRVWDVGVRA